MKQYRGFLDTAPLWKNTQFNLTQFDLPVIDLENFKPQPIPKNIRLGHRVEYILKQLLDYSKRYDVLAHNVQIKRGKETIGELDFILRDRGNGEENFGESEFIHLELTYKFYLLDPTISEPIHRLMGPNRRDMFFTKMEKTRDKQLPLLHSPEGKELLRSLHLQSEEITQQTYFLGQLFTPYIKEYPSIRPLNTKAIVGYWMDFETFNSNDFKSFTFYIPLKYEWIHHPHTDVQWQSHFNTLMEINMRHIKNNAPMVWIKNGNGSIEKCFVVWW